MKGVSEVIRTKVFPRHSWLGRKLRRIRNILDRPRSQVIDETELLRRTDEYNRYAEDYWRAIDSDPAARANALAKPFTTLKDAAHVLYRLGMVLGELRTGPGQTLLELGAGTCWLSAICNRLGCRTISMDVSPTALKLGRESFSLDRRQRPELEPQFMAYDGHRFPLPNESVDRIVCFDAFHHIPNPDEILAEVFRVLRTGGRAVFAEPGMGHAQESHSRAEAGRFRILENGLDIRRLAAVADRLGFAELLVKPYPDAVAISLSAREYFRLMDGADRFFPVEGLRRNLRNFHVFILTKGRGIFDSRNPGILRAKITVDGNIRGIQGAPGESVGVGFSVKNCGDTLWRHEESPTGGYVRLGGHLLAGSGEPANWDFLRVSLPGPVAPGETCQLKALIHLPDRRGRYLLQLDLVDEGIAWFEEQGSPTVRLEVIVDGA